MNDESGNGAGGGPRLRVAVNAVPIAPGGGMVVVVGILRAWRHVAPDLDPTVYASRPQVIEAIREARPDVPVVPFALGHSPAFHFAAQQTRLGPALERDGFDVVLSQGMLVGRCRLPQVVHHQNLTRFVRSEEHTSELQSLAYL